MKKLILLLPLLVVACGGGENSLKEKGMYTCTSNKGNPTLSFHSSTFSYQTDFNSTSVSFTDLGTGNVYRLDSVEDRDYNCIITERDIG